MFWLLEVFVFVFVFSCSYVKGGYIWVSSLFCFMRINNQADLPSLWFGLVWYKVSNKIWQKFHKVLHVNATLTSITPSLTRGDFRQITQILKISHFSSENKDSNHHILLLGRRSKADIKGLEESVIPAFSWSVCLGLCILSLNSSYSPLEIHWEKQNVCSLFSQWWLTECWFIDSISEEVKWMPYFSGVKWAIQQVSCRIYNILSQDLSRYFAISPN